MGDWEAYWGICMGPFNVPFETYKALGVAIADGDCPLAGRWVAQVLNSRWAPAKVLGHMCDAGRQ